MSRFLLCSVGITMEVFLHFVLFFVMIFFCIEFCFGCQGINHPSEGRVVLSEGLVGLENVVRASSHGDG